MASFISLVDKAFNYLKGRFQEKDDGKEEEERISKLANQHEKNEKTCEKIPFNEMSAKYDRLEGEIKFLYEKYNNMIEKLKKDPEHAKQHKENFREEWLKKTNTMSLDEFYNGIMEKPSIFGSKVMTVHMDYHNKSRVCMEAACKHLECLICKGLIVEMANSAIRQEEEINEWEEKFYEIQAKMQKNLE